MNPKPNYSETLSQLLFDFFKIIKIEPIEFSKGLLESSEQLIESLCKHAKKGSNEDAVIRSIKRKLKLEETNFKYILDQSAIEKFYFNSVEKNGIYKNLYDNNIDGLKSILKRKGMSDSLIRSKFTSLKPILKKEVLSLFHEQVDNPINRRTKQVDLSLQATMLESIFSAYIYESFEEKYVHSLNCGSDAEEYEEDYWKFIHSDTDGHHRRDHALSFISLNSKEFKGFSFDELREKLSNHIVNAYSDLDNHSYMFIHIPAQLTNLWELVSDSVLFAEKFIEKGESISYFKPVKIHKETEADIGTPLDFDLFKKINEGFFYKDAFCLYPDDGDNSLPSVLLVFRKDVRDETKIPCPKCRSTKVQGNSYPKLGVKSWECKNVLCADRSMSNRGKRFSFESLLKQRSIDCPDSQISKSLIAKWKRDVLFNVNDEDIYEYVVKCYSLPQDTVYFYNSRPMDSYERTMLCLDDVQKSNTTYWKDFTRCDFFNRWLFFNVNEKSNSIVKQDKGVAGMTILKGDSEYTLGTVEANTIDGAVTSPPYFNAREYSQYSNVYSYLNKMASIGKEVYRTLKPGAVFLYNIFDYFDNENIVIHSAMGKKRMILSSYIVHSFREIGFELVTNIPWDKGEIEGKRAYNSGNLTPFYQSPLNCWEHILVFKKPGDINHKWPGLLKCKPVFKMIKGENKYGHTAPFPKDIPDLLVKHLNKGETVLDPFAGSGTTALAAKMCGVNSLMCEASEDYVELIKSKLR